MNIKTLTVTWTSYNNYGTLLQAYALQKEIEILGFQNVILSDELVIDKFRSKWKKGQPATEHSNNLLLHASTKAKLLTSPGRLRRILMSRFCIQKYSMPFEDSQDKCTEFRRHDLKILEIDDLKELISLGDKYDKYIAGSDQIWSLSEDIYDPFYYLDFAKYGKISYAPSLRLDAIDEKKKKDIRKLVSDYIAVSTRERNTAEQLMEITGKEVEWVADPTLLLEKEKWDDFSSEIKVPRKKYLLCYFLEDRKWYFEYAKKVAKEQGLSILLIPSKWDFLKSEFIIETGIGPKEFVSLFKNARYIITDSYHGSLFSLIFHKEFHYLLRFPRLEIQSQNNRIFSLFQYLNITDRIVEDVNSIPHGKIDYVEVDKKIEDLRNKSIDYLKENIIKGK